MIQHYPNPDIFIKSFYEIITLKLGAVSHSDSLVNDELSMFVVDTNGAIEYHDYFRAFKDKSIKTDYNIFKNTISGFESDEIFDKCIKLKNQLPDSCTNCRQVSICGGGFLPGRMKSNIKDFSVNKSVLCYDQKYFFEQVESILQPAIAQLSFS